MTRPPVEKLLLIKHARQRKAGKDVSTVKVYSCTKM